METWNTVDLEAVSKQLQSACEQRQERESESRFHSPVLHKSEPRANVDEVQIMICDLQNNTCLDGDKKAELIAELKVAQLKQKLSQPLPAQVDYISLPPMPEQARRPHPADKLLRLDVSQMQWLSSYLQQNGSIFSNITVVPRAQDISHTLGVFTTAITLLCPDIVVQDLGAKHVIHIGPLLIGNLAWAKLASQRHIQGWDDFVEGCQKLFGIDVTQLVDDVLNWSPYKGEAAEDFIQRVNDQVEKLQQPQELTSRVLCKTFLPLLQGAFAEHIKGQVDGACESGKFGWEWVVDRASAWIRRGRRGYADSIWNEGGRQKGLKGDIEKIPCGYCIKMGLPSHHDRDKCFVDPTSKSYRPNVAKDRKEKYGVNEGTTLQALAQQVKQESDHLHSDSLHDFFGGELSVEEIEHFSQIMNSEFAADSKQEVQTELTARIFHTRDLAPPVMHVEKVTDGIDEILLRDMNPIIIDNLQKMEGVQVEELLHTMVEDENNIGKWGVDVVRKLENAADTIEVFVNSINKVDSVNNFDDLHMDESLGIKRNAGWLEGESTFGISRHNQQLPKELRQAVARIKYNMSILQASKMDQLFCLYLLTLLIDMQNKDGLSIVVPQGTKITSLKTDKFKRLQMGLGSLTPAQYEQAAEFLSNMKSDSSDSEPGGYSGNKKVRTDVAFVRDYCRSFASAIAEVIGGEDEADKIMQLVDAKWGGNTNQLDKIFSTQGKEGEWKDEAVKHPEIKYGLEQFIVEVGVNGHLVPALIDSGGEVSMIDVRLAERLGLKYMRARGGEFGRYQAPGGQVFAYHGLIRGPLTLQLSQKVTIPLVSLKVVDHGEDLLLLGADFLRGGRPSHYYGFDSIGLDSTDPNQVKGYITFVKLGVVEKIPLLNVPLGKSNRRGGEVWARPPPLQAMVVHKLETPAQFAAKLIKKGKFKAAEGVIKLAKHRLTKHTFRA